MVGTEKQHDVKDADGDQPMMRERKNQLQNLKMHFQICCAGDQFCCIHCSFHRVLREVK